MIFRNFLLVFATFLFFFGPSKNVFAEETPPLNPEGISEYSRWSPDGTKIAFVSSRDGNWEIYVIDADGSNLTRLTKNLEHDAFPTWSPDSKKIAFSSTATGFSRNFPSLSAIFVMDANGENRKRLTNTEVGADSPVPYYNDTVPIWSPDGQKIGFLSDRRNGFREIFLMNPNGTDITRVTFQNLHHWNIGWTHDSKRILFDARMDGFVTPASNPIAGIFSVNASGPKWFWGEDTTPVINEMESGLEFDSNVSLDGKKILFLNGQKDPEKRTGLRGMSFAELDYVDGKPKVIKETIIQRDAENQYSPFWSPDGTKVTFTSTRDGHPEIYVADEDGSNVKRLTFSRPETSEE